MIRKSAKRFSEKIMRNQQPPPDARNASRFGPHDPDAVLLLRPGHVVSHRGHGREPGGADRDLHHERIRPCDQQEVCGKGEKDARAECGEPFLATFDDGPKRGRLETGSVARNEPGEKEGEREEMQQAVRGEVLLAVQR